MKHLKLRKAFESWIFWNFEYKQGFGKGFKACFFIRTPEALVID